jgi:hypothetical protein
MKNLRFISFAMLLMLMGGLVTVSSCKKDDDDPATKTQTLSGKKFFIKSMPVDPPVDVLGNLVDDFITWMPDCSKDDFIIFNENGTFVNDEGATKCEPTDPQTENGTWVFLNNEKQIRLTVDGDAAQTMDIDELTNSKLKFSYSETNNYGDGDKLYRYTIVFETR